MARMSVRGLLSGCALIWAAAGAWAQPPTVAQMLSFKPSHEVQISTPTADELASCEVKLVKGAKAGTSGWLLLDAKKQPLRRFFDSSGKNKIDIWSYYKDGVEVYREIDSNHNGRPDQYRWLNGGGMKWGISSKENGVIDAWRMISAEEVGHEIFSALATRDPRRLEALFLSEAEMRTLKLPAAEIDRITKLQKQASSKFQATLTKLPQLDDKATFIRVEAVTPSCIPAETYNGEQDLIKFAARAILFESGGVQKKHDWVQSGEMIQVGLAWRLVDGPNTQEAAGGNAEQPVAADNPKLRPALEKLGKLDEEGKKIEPSNKNALQNYNIQRADLIESILAIIDAKDSDSWYRQLFDNLGDAVQAGHEASLVRMAKLRAQIETKMSGSSLAAYGAYRELWATYGPKINSTTEPKAFAKLQDEWHEKLAKFVQTYKDSDDAPDALNQLAMGAEYSGKDDEAKRWNQQIYTRFPNHHLAERAKGAERRLDMVSKPFVLSGPQLGNGASFDVKELKNKVVAVYFWASNVDACVRDFDVLQKLKKDYPVLEIVCVSLDDKAADVERFLQRNRIQAIHLFQEAKEGGGINSPLATYYGINGLPTLFLVGKDGRVISRSLQVGELEPELKKAQ